MACSGQKDLPKAEEPVKRRRRTRARELRRGPLLVFGALLFQIQPRTASCCLPSIRQRKERRRRRMENETWGRRAGRGKREEQREDGNGGPKTEAIDG